MTKDPAAKDEEKGDFFIVYSSQITASSDTNLLGGNLRKRNLTRDGLEKDGGELLRFDDF